MKNSKPSKEIIQEAIKSVIKNEGVFDNISAGISGLAGGVKNTFQGIGANYQLGKIDAQMKQFADKTEKQWDVNKDHASKASFKMANSKNRNIAQTGQAINTQIDAADKYVKKALSNIKNSISTAALNVGASDTEINQATVQNQFKSPEVQKQLDAEFAKRMPQQSKTNVSDFESWAQEKLGMDIHDKINPGKLASAYKLYQHALKAGKINPVQGGHSAAPSPAPAAPQVAAAPKKSPVLPPAPPKKMAPPPPPKFDPELEKHVKDDNEVNPALPAKEPEAEPLPLSKLKPVPSASKEEPKKIEAPKQPKIDKNKMPSIGQLMDKIGIDKKQFKNTPQKQITQGAPKQEKPKQLPEPQVQPAGDKVFTPKKKVSARAKPKKDNK